MQGARIGVARQVVNYNNSDPYVLGLFGQALTTLQEQGDTLSQNKLCRLTAASRTLTCIRLYKISGRSRAFVFQARKDWPPCLQGPPEEAVASYRLGTRPQDSALQNSLCRHSVLRQIGLSLFIKANSLLIDDMSGIAGATLVDPFTVSGNSLGAKDWDGRSSQWYTGFADSGHWEDINCGAHFKYDVNNYLSSAGTKYKNVVVRPQAGQPGDES